MIDGDDPFPDPVVLPVEDALDLHAFAPQDIPSVVEEYLDTAWSQGFDQVRLIHGKGRGVQRRRVRSVLERHSKVARFGEAPEERGGWGATLVWLKRDDS